LDFVQFSKGLPIIRLCLLVTPQSFRSFVYARWISKRYAEKKSPAELYKGELAVDAASVQPAVIYPLEYLNQDWQQ
jgi:hypothetical protein